MKTFTCALMLLLLATAPAFAGPPSPGLSVSTIGVEAFATVDNPLSTPHPYVDDSTTITDSVETVAAKITMIDIPVNASVSFVAYFGFGLSGTPFGIVRVRKGADLNGPELDRIYLNYGAPVIPFPIVDPTPSTPSQSYILTITSAPGGEVGIGRIRIFPNVHRQ